MKRIIEFQVLDEKYLFKENSVSIFEINKSTRQLDVKSFYEAFFSGGKDYTEIEMTSSELNKDDERIYNAINKLVNDICSRLKKEIPTKSENADDIQSYKLHE